MNVYLSQVVLQSRRLENQETTHLPSAMNEWSFIQIDNAGKQHEFIHSFLHSSSWTTVEDTWSWWWFTAGVRLTLTSADDLVEVEQQLFPGDHHVLHLCQQVRVETGRVYVDRSHQQRWHQLAIHPQTHPGAQRPQSGRHQLAVASKDRSGCPARLRPVCALIWRGRGDEVSGQRSATVSARPLHEVKVWSRRQTVTWP